MGYGPAMNAPPVYLDAELRPNRSLGPRGFRWLMGGLLALSVAAGIVFVSIGAWPVFGFFGLDMLLIWLAFRASYRSGAMLEYLRLTRDALDVTRIHPSGREQRWSFQPLWVRVSLPRPVRHESQLSLSSHGRRLVVGSFLSPRERGEVADALEDALRRMRRAPARFGPRPQRRPSTSAMS